jgi:hypothetical protein
MPSSDPYNRFGRIPKCSEEVGGVSELQKVELRQKFDIVRKMVYRFVKHVTDCQLLVSWMG